MRNRNFGLGVLMALAAIPLCAVIASPLAAQSAAHVLSLWQPLDWRVPFIEAREKRPWLNPARAALMI